MIKTQFSRNLIMAAFWAAPADISKQQRGIGVYAPYTAQSWLMRLASVLRTVNGLSAREPEKLYQLICPSRCCRYKAR